MYRQAELRGSLRPNTADAIPNDATLLALRAFTAGTNAPPSGLSSLSPKTPSRRMRPRPNVLTPVTEAQRMMPRTPSRIQRDRRFHHLEDLASPTRGRPVARPSIGAFTRSGRAFPYSWTPIWFRTDRDNATSPFSSSRPHLTAPESEHLPVFPNRFVMPNKNMWHDHSHCFRNSPTRIPFPPVILDREQGAK